MRMAALLARPRNTEKTNAVVERSGRRGSQRETGSRMPASRRAAGHGRNGAEAFTGARKVEIAHPEPETRRSLPGVRARQCIRAEGAEGAGADCGAGAAGGDRVLAGAVALRRLRAGVHGEEPEGVGPEKYDETAAAMIAQLKYGSGIPFYRLEQLEDQLGIPLPAATQWEIVEEAAEVIKPARDELIRQAAQGEVLHNDDTGMRVLKLEREPGDEAHRRVHQRHRFHRRRAERSRCTSPGASTRARISRTC